MKRSIWVVVIVQSIGMALGAAQSVSVGEDTYHLHTGSAGGSCEVLEREDGSQDTTCSDRSGRATFNSVTGCSDSTGTGYCAKNTPHRPGRSGSELNCPSGISYFLDTGKADATCTMRDGLKTCRSADGGSYASAGCENGCDNTGGSGGCCQVGTKGCPPVPRTQPTKPTEPPLPTQPTQPTQPAQPR